jgi:hypothetical protein
MPLNTKLVEKFLSLVIKASDEDACWGWSGHLNAGVPTLMFKNKRYGGRVVSLTLCDRDVENPISSICGNKLCLNPKHLVSTTLERFWSYVNKKTNNVGSDGLECWEWQASKNDQGYGTFQTKFGSIRAHRYSYEIHFGPIDGYHVLHVCDNPSCIRPEHLKLGTNEDNVKDRNNKNRNIYGEENFYSVLTESQVLEITDLYFNKKLSYAKLAIIYNVHEYTIRKILTGKSWKHVERTIKNVDISAYEKLLDIKLVAQKYIDLFHQKISFDPNGCWNWTGAIDKRGYGNLLITVNGKDKRVKSHRLSYIIHNNILLENDAVCHTCDNPRCCNPKHLFVGSAQDNVNDKIAKNRQIRGTMQHNAKLNDEIIKQIIIEYNAGGTSYAKLGKKYNLGKNYIYKIVKRLIWKHVQV